MKRKIRYLIIIGLLLILTCVQKVEFFYSEAVVEGTVKSIPPVEWRTVVAESVNSKPIILMVDGKQVETARDRLYMDSNSCLLYTSTEGICTV